MTKFFATLFLMICPLTSFAALTQPAPRSVDALDLSQYVGTWYQISHIPLSFEFGGQPCPCARQILTAQQNSVGVENTCNLKTSDGPYIDIKGFAVPSNANSPSQFTVTLQVTPTQKAVGPYWVIGIDPLYRYSVVSNDTGTSLYILSRTPELDSALYQEALAISDAQGIDRSKLALTSHQGCRYP